VVSGGFVVTEAERRVSSQRDLGRPASRSLEHSAAQSKRFTDSTSPPSISLASLYACSTSSMNPTNPCNIFAWIDRVDSTPQEMYARHIMFTSTRRALTASVSSTSIPPLYSQTHDDKENPRREMSKRRLMDDIDLDETARPLK
jgi:hypothetical protein